MRRGWEKLDPNSDNDEYKKGFQNQNPTVMTQEKALGTSALYLTRTSHN